MYQDELLYLTRCCKPHFVAGHNLLRTTPVCACNHSWLFKEDVKRCALERYLLRIAAVIQLAAANLQAGGF
jgi:hypothetical protein